MEVQDIVSLILETILETVTEYILNCFKCIEDQDHMPNDDGTVSNEDQMP